MARHVRPLLSPLETTQLQRAAKHALNTEGLLSPIGMQALERALAKLDLAQQTHTRSFGP
jgi:hypothetical protein